MTTTKREAMTGVLSRAGRMIPLTLAAAVGTAVVSPSSASAQVRMTVPPQSEPVALQGATIRLGRRRGGSGDAARGGRSFDRGAASGG